MPGKHPGEGDARACAAGTKPGGRIGANAAWRPGAILALNLHTLSAWWPPDEDLAWASWMGIQSVLLIHAGRLAARGRPLVLRLRKAGTEGMQAALKRLVAQPVAPG